ncbi:UV excision repair protein Rad23 [Allomyces macrogynus ATCC 38327]|uniref:UV excision repair protein RAD23 n=1 Tax=Allomyces macrogynus (strain ATCC 38327) TaxID=578462 RepID=A0A0L0SUF7_ALLM3|nr:UV excision repair protein Rad23 [Allomyces macrogynus ATCC 38327]|eukprot:KNE66152.1 UV excision repair protein Rad23 [Allomyces macrogynus ATCC 38327]
MKLTIKTINQKAIPLDVEPSTTVANIKEMLHQSQGFDVAAQKLIYSGKILTDDQTIEALKVKETDFMVVMVTKAKAALAASSAAPAPAARGLGAVSTPSAPTGGAAAAAPAAPAAPAADPNNLFALAQQQAQQQQQQQAAQAGGVGAGAFDLTALANDPQVAQLRQMIQQNPQLLQPILGQLAASNPALMAMLQQNPQAVLSALLGEDVMLDDASDDEGGALPPGVQQIAVTEEDRAAIDRLVDLGFDRNLAIEAYLACDKNEELAANYLFENQFE